MIPAELTERDQWVMWRREVRDAKPTKVPYSPVGKRASTTDPSTWSAFEEARRAAPRFDGIGYVFSAADGLVGLDFDNCRSHGHLNPIVWNTVRYLDSWCEISPSDTGVHVFVKAQLNGHANRCSSTAWGGTFEVYDRGRYFTVGDRQLAGTPDSIEERQQQLDDVLSVLLPTPQLAPVLPAPDPGPLDLDDEQLLEKARRARGGDKFTRLFDHGDIAGFGSHSEADLALCSSIAFWTGPDPDRIDRLFSRSRLMRDKWARTDYSSRTITTALSGRTDFYRQAGSSTPSKPLVTVPPLAAVQPHAREAVVRASASIHPQPVEYAWEGRWPLKSVSLVVGVWGVNKSMLTLDAAARVSRGQLAGDLRGQPRSVIVASAEDSPAHSQVPRLMAAGADREKVFFISIALADFESDISLPEDIEALEKAIVQYEASLVIVDPLTAHLGVEVNSHKDQDVRRVLGPLARVADRTGCSIVAVVHLNKMPSTDLFMKIGGSVGIGAAARSILLVATDPEGEDQGPDRVVVHGKSNVGPFAPTLRFKVEGRTITHPDGKEIDTAGIVWTGDAPGMGTSRVLGGVPAERPAPARDAAKELLEEMLADGPRLRSDIEAAGKAAGVSFRTLATAKAALEIVSEQPPELGKIGRGPAYWSLPKKPAPIGVQIPIANEVAHQIPAGQGMDSEFGVQGMQGMRNEVAHQPSRSFPFSKKRLACDICQTVTFYVALDGRPFCPRHKRGAEA